MTYNNLCLWYKPLNKSCNLFYVLHSVIHKKYLSSTRKLKHYCISYYFLIKCSYFCCYWLTIRWSSSNNRKVSCSHKRELKCSWYWCCSKSKCVYIYFHLLYLLFYSNAKLLFFINDKQTKVFKMHIFTYYSVSSNKIGRAHV